MRRQGYTSEGQDAGIFMTRIRPGYDAGAVSGAIDSCVLGSQSLRYSVSDGANTAVATRTVNVVGGVSPPTARSIS